MSLGDSSAAFVLDPSARGRFPVDFLGQDSASTTAQINFDDPRLAGVLRDTSRHLSKIGRVNVVVAGQTGVGKSSLINAVFGETFARTAAGRPVTQQAEWFVSNNIPLRILDTKGLEAKDYTATVEDLRYEIELGRNEKHARDQLHVAWVCIAAPSSRIQDAEIDVIRLLNRYQIPTVIVLTKYHEDYEDFISDVERVLDGARTTRQAIVPVRAVVKRGRQTEGLTELVVATFEALPAAHRAAFAASQKVNLDLNRSAAMEYVTAAAAAAGAAAVIPIPFMDVITLAPIQAAMMLGVSAAFGLSIDGRQVVQLLGTVMSCMALSLAGRWIAGNALKLVPGAGSVAGAVLNAGIAGALTLKLGQTYINFLHAFVSGKGRVPRTEEILSSFPEYFRTAKKDFSELSFQD